MPRGRDFLMLVRRAGGDGERCGERPHAENVCVRVNKMRVGDPNMQQRIFPATFVYFGEALSPDETHPESRSRFRKAGAAQW